MYELSQDCYIQPTVMNGEIIIKRYEYLLNFMTRGIIYLLLYLCIYTTVSIMSHPYNSGTF